MAKTAKRVDDAYTANDVGQWGDKDTRGAYDGPLNIAGELVSVDDLPKFGSDGDEANKSARAPLLPPGSS